MKDFSLAFGRAILFGSKQDDGKMIYQIYWTVRWGRVKELLRWKI